MFCRYCGYKLNDNAQFCISCGMKVNKNTDTSPAPSQPVQMRPGTQHQTEIEALRPSSSDRGANSPVGTAPVKADGSQQSKPKKKKRTALIVVLCLSALLVAGLVIGGIFVLKGFRDGSLNLTGNASDSTKKVKAATLKDTVLSFDGVTLDYGDNAVPEDAKEALAIADLGGKAPPDGLASSLYDLTIDPTYTEPVTISIPYTEDLADLDNTAVPMLGIGTVVTYEDGTTSKSYQYLEAKVKDNIATTTFVPSEVIGITATGASKGAAASSVSYTSSSTTTGAKHGLESVSAGIIWCSTTFRNGGNFVVYFPAQAHKFFIDYNDREAFLTDLE